MIVWDAAAALALLVHHGAVYLRRMLFVCAYMSGNDYSIRHDGYFVGMLGVSKIIKVTPYCMSYNTNENKLLFSAMIF